MTKEELYKEYISDSTLYCCYCGCEQFRFSCCQENHFETFSEMSKENQLEMVYNDDRLQIIP